MTATQAPTPGPLSVEISYEVYQGDDFCASAVRLQDAEHYANVYGQDGPVKCQTVVSVRHDDFLLPDDPRLAPTAPVEASGSERERLAKIVERLGPVMANNASPEQHADWLDLVRHVQALRPQPSGETREQIVSAIRQHIELGNIGACSAEIVGHEEAADAILALLSARPLALGGQQGVDEDWIRGLIGEAIVMNEDQERADEGDEELSRISDGVLKALRPHLSTTPARAEAQDEGAAGEPVGHIRGVDDVLVVDWAQNVMPPAGTALYTHPSTTPAADADRVRIAVEAFNAKINAPLTGPTHGAWDRGRIAGLKEALAALKSAAAKEGGEV